MENVVQNVIAIALCAIFLVAVAIKPIRDWFFGPPEIDDSKGFPYSRNKNKKRKDR
jgi:hypothetical protein